MNEVKKTVKFSKSFLFLIAFIILLFGVIAPVSYLIYSASSDLIFSNMTEGTNLGARLQAAVLSMDFNQNGENYLNLPYQNRTLYEQGTYIKDGSVYNNYGTSSGLTAQYWWNGNTNGTSVINGSLQFDGVNDYVVGPTFNFSNYEGYTVSGWFKRNDNQLYKIIWQFTNSNSFGPDASGWIKWSMVGYADAYCSASPSLLSNWTYITTTWQRNSSMKIYLNGNLCGSSSFNGTAIGGPLHIGANSGSNALNGSIDDVIIWSRALNATEISDIYNNGLAGNSTYSNPFGVDTRSIPSDGRVAYWSFNTNESGNYTEQWNGIYNTTCNDNSSTCVTWNATTGAYNTGNINLKLNKPLLVANSLNLLNGTNQYTLSAWVYNSNLINRINIINSGEYDSVNAAYPGLRWSYGYPSITHWSTGKSSGIQLSSSYAIPQNEWSFLTGTFNYTSGSTGTLKLYVNGNLVTSVSSTSLNTSFLQNSSYYIGGLVSDIAPIDEVMIFNKTLSDTEIQSLYDNTRKKLHLKLDETSGTTASDYLGTMNGTLTGYPTATGTAPIYNATGGVNNSGAYTFDGVDDKISFYATLTSDMTECAWVKPISTPSTFLRIIDNAASATFVIGSDKHIYFVSNNIYFESPIALTLNNWTHTCVTRKNNNNCSMYINGNRTINDICGTNTGSGTTFVGNTLAGNNGFNGSIDNVQIFNRALSAEEVLSLYDGTNANRTIKYSATQGDLTSGVFYNTTQAYWNVTLATADTINRSGLVNTDNSINISNPNLVSYWPLDGNYLDGTGIINFTCGGACPNNATGLSSGAIKFDIGSRLVIGQAMAPNLSVTNFTISTWVYHNNYASPTYQAILGKGGDYGDDIPQYVLKMYNGYVSFVAYNSACNGYASGGGSNVLGNSASVPISTGQWIHITLNRVGNNITFYKNGAYANSSIMSDSVLCNTNLAYERFHIGGAGYNYVSRYFNGTIDEVLIYNASLSASQVSQLYKSGLSQHASTNVTIQTRTATDYNTTDPSLVAFWAMNENNNLIAIDETGKNNGTYINGALSNSTSGFVGSGGYFNGSGYSIIPNNTNILDGANAITISAWIYQNSGGGAYDGIVTINGSGQLTGLRMYDVSYRPSLYLNNVGVVADGTASSRALPTNKWHYIAGTWDTISDTGRIYVDGILLASGGISIATINANNSIYLGNDAMSPSSTRAWNGMIDEVRIYNRSLSADEVLNLYNLGSYHLTDWSAWSNPQTCYDNETKIQTQSGWKLFKDLNSSDKVATLNPKTNEIEYKLPSEYQVYDAPEFMYKITTEKGEMTVSPDHKVYSATENRGYWKLVVGIILIVLGLAGLFWVRAIKKLG